MDSADDIPTDLFALFANKGDDTPGDEEQEQDLPMVSLPSFRTNQKANVSFSFISEILIFGCTSIKRTS